MLLTCLATENYELSMEACDSGDYTATVIAGEGTATPSNPNIVLLVGPVAGGMTHYRITGVIGAVTKTRDVWLNTLATAAVAPPGVLSTATVLK